MKRALLALLLVASPVLAQAQNGWIEIENGWGEMQTPPGFTTIPPPSGCTTGSLGIFLGSLTCVPGLTWAPGTAETPAVLGPELITDGDFVDASGWAPANNWNWESAVSPESGCMTHTTGSVDALLSLNPIPTASLVAGHTYQLSVGITGTTIGTVTLHLGGNDDDSWLQDLTESVTLDFLALDYGGQSVAVELIPTSSFDGSVCSISIREVVTPAAPATAARVDLDGTLRANTFAVAVLNDAPVSAGAPCMVGEIRWTATHVYLCSATDTWVRAALATWP